MAAHYCRVALHDASVGIWATPEVSAPSDIPDARTFEPSSLRCVPRCRCAVGEHGNVARGQARADGGRRITAGGI